MNKFEESLLTGDVELAIKLCRLSKWLKVVLAVIVAYAYFSEAAWLVEVMVISVVLSLVLPLGFFDVFIQKLT